MTSSHPSYLADPRVDVYIDALPGWQRTICHRLRDLIHAADPELTETIKRTVQPNFVLEDNVCALLATKDHVTCSSTTAGSCRIRRTSSPSTSPAAGAN